MVQPKKLLLTAIILAFSMSPTLSMAKTSSNMLTLSHLSHLSHLSPMDMTTINDDIVLNFIHYVNQGEITEANDALQRLTTPGAKSFAQTMIADHQQSEQQVSQLATQKGLTLYDYQPSTVDMAADAQLQNVPDANFDQAYLNMQLMDHQKALQDIKLLQTQVTDTDLQALITQTIPVIQKHIDLAKSTLNG